MLLNDKSYICIPSLISVLTESFDTASPTELQMEVNNLPNFFFEVLQFCERIQDDVKMNEDPQISLKDISIEESASKALMALHLKLSEITFRPYDKLYKWARIHSTSSEI